MQAFRYRNPKTTAADTLRGPLFPPITSSLQSPPQKLTAGDTSAAPRLSASALTVDQSEAASVGVRLACG